MNIKRSIGFGVLLWISAFVIISILMFSPWFSDSETRIHVGWWILEIPLVLLLAKWYFKADPPTLKKGFLLGLIGLLVANLLDLAITVPFVVKSSYNEFYGNWTLWVGFALVLLLTSFAGFEYDATYSKQEKEEKKK
jgi:hypothetical protein